MPMPTLAPLVLLVCVAAIPGSALRAQSPSTLLPKADYADPVRIQVGDEFLGSKRHYPSPVFHDLNGDGRLDILIGDLVGDISAALQGGGDTIRFEPDYYVLGKDQRPLRFHNW